MHNDNVDRPIIKCFTINNNYYFYDTYTNKILQVSKQQFIEIQQLLRIGTNNYMCQNKCTRAYDDIIMLIKTGFLKSGFVSKIQHPETEKIGTLLDRCLSYIQIQTTKDCNFKCRYCAYAQNSGIGRCHERRYMTWEIAKSSIDFLYSHSPDSHNIRVSFYGGEPLLNYELIQNVVSYTKRSFFTKTITFHITTNASLINDDIIKFFVENNFYILISLDGPEELQNNHRRFIRSGGPTFKTVFSNVERIKTQYPEYFRTNVRFNSVIFSDERKEEVFDFYRNNNIDVNNVSVQNADILGFDYDLKLISLYSINNIEGSVNKNEAFDNIIQKNNLINNIWHPNGVCIPGVGRLFVNTDGNFFPCEKVSECSATKIGDLKNGFDVSKIIQFANIGKITEDKCKKCWAMRFCSMCICHCTDLERNIVSACMKEVYCELEKKTAFNQLVSYVDKKCYKVCAK